MFRLQPWLCHAIPWLLAARKEPSLPSTNHQHSGLLALLFRISPKRNSRGNSYLNVPPRGDRVRKALWRWPWHWDAEVTSHVRHDPVHTCSTTAEPLRLQGSFDTWGGSGECSGECSGEHLGQPELLCKPRISRPASHLRLTGEAQTHRYSREEAAKGNTQVTNELIGNTYLPH